MLTRTKDRLAPSIGLMHHILLRCIFDNATLEEWHVLEDGIKSWRNKINLMPDEKWELDRIENALLADSKGYFDRAKELIKEHNLDYMRFYKAGIPFVNPNRKFWNKS